MTTVLTVAGIVVAALTAATALAIPVGKYLHRAAHRQGVADPRDCPPWCVRERAAAIFGSRRRHAR